MGEHITSRPFGKTGFNVSILGYGAGHIGSPDQSEREIDFLLNAIVDLGITLIDTARGYNLSEERIGKFLSHRRKDFILSTKVGYGIPGQQDWTYGCIEHGINTALHFMRTDYIDIVHLHSCPKDILERGEVLDALHHAKQKGKIRAVAYSGDNDPLNYATECGRFDSVETSVNIADQRVIDSGLAIAKKIEMGVIAKRPVANGPWRYAERPVGNYCEEYWHRFKTMNVDPSGMDWQEIAIRFTAFTEGVSSCIVGTTKLEHVKQNLSYIQKGPLPQDQYDSIRAAFKNWDRDWIGQV